MTVKQKSTGRASSMGAGLLTGGLVSLGITIVGAMLSAAMISRETIPANSIGYCSMVILLLSSLLGSMIAAGKIKHRRVYVCVLSGVIYYGMLLGATALFFGGQYQGIGVTALLVTAGCGLTILMGMRGEKQHPGHRTRIRRH